MSMNLEDIYRGESFDDSPFNETGKNETKLESLRLDVVKRIKKYARKYGILDDIIVHEARHNHYSYSFVIENKDTGKFMYLSISDVRFRKNVFDDVLYRSMEHSKDFSGGINNFAPLEEAIECMVKGTM